MEERVRGRRKEEMACWRDEGPRSCLNWGRADDDFMHFLRPWLDRAATARSRLNRDPFPGLIYSWVAFNAWLGQTVEDRDIVGSDRRLVQVAAFDPRLSGAFDDLRGENSEAGAQCREFHGLWPVFKARALVDRGLEPWRVDHSRDEFRAHCFLDGLGRGDWSPRCFVAHQGTGVSPSEYSHERVPHDWLHAIQAVYQVRCNLFHGGKSFRSDGDMVFVRLATAILWDTWTRSGAMRR